MQRTVEAVLEDHPTKRVRTGDAELSRPGRAHNERLRKDKKPQGRKRQHEPQEAIYHNWHTPFLWRQILEAARDPSVGKKMGSWMIMKVLRKKDAETFKALSHTTIEGWIDRKDREHPRWSDAALRMGELGNHQGHSNGGRKGALVSASAPQLLQ